MTHPIGEVWLLFEDFVCPFEAVYRFVYLNVVAPHTLGKSNTYSMTVGYPLRIWREILVERRIIYLCFPLVVIATHYMTISLTVLPERIKCLPNTPSLFDTRAYNSNCTNQREFKMSPGAMFGNLHLYAVWFDKISFSINFLLMFMR